MATFSQQIQSKTIRFNAITAAIIAILKILDIEVPTEVVTGVFTIGNYIFRLITKEPLSAKGQSSATSE